MQTNLADNCQFEKLIDENIAEWMGLTGKTFNAIGGNHGVGRLGLSTDRHDRRTRSVNAITRHPHLELCEHCRIAEKARLCDQ